jgi:hypothetical protein
MVPAGTADSSTAENSGRRADPRPSGDKQKGKKGKKRKREEEGSRDETKRGPGLIFARVVEEARGKGVGSLCRLFDTCDLLDDRLLRRLEPGHQPYRLEAPLAHKRHHRGPVSHRRCNALVVVVVSRSAASKTKRLFFFLSPHSSSSSTRLFLSFHRFVLSFPLALLHFLSITFFLHFSISFSLSPFFLSFFFIFFFHSASRRLLSRSHAGESVV